MDQHKVISDWVISTQDTIYILQEWVGRLEIWQSLGQAEADDFNDACQQLQEAGLWSWAGQAAGHGIGALARAVGVAEDYPADDSLC